MILLHQTKSIARRLIDVQYSILLPLPTFCLGRRPWLANDNHKLDPYDAFTTISRTEKGHF